MGAAILPIAGYSTLTATSLVESSVDAPLTCALVSSVETAFFQQKHQCSLW